MKENDRRRRGTSRIKLRIMAILVICSILPLGILGVVIAGQYYQSMQKNLTELYCEAVEELSLNIASRVQPFVDLLYHYIDSEELAAMMEETPATAKERTALAARFKEFFNNREIAVRVGYPYYYSVFTGDGATYSFYENRESIPDSVAGSDWYEALRQTRYRQVKAGIGPAVFGIESMDRLYIAASIFHQNRNVGVVALSVSTAFLSGQLDKSSFADADSLFLLDTAGRRVSSSSRPGCSLEEVQALVAGRRADTEAAMEIVRVGGKPSILTVTEIPLLYTGENWKLVTVIPREKILRESTGVLNATLTLIVVTAALVMIVLLVINARLLTPLADISTAMASVADGDYSMRLKGTGEGEVVEMAKAFNFMVGEVAQSQERIRREEENKRELEFRILQAQIRPHFVSNTLNTIRVMANVQGMTAISRALTSFISLIEYYFRDNASTATIDAELGHLEEYLYLQNLRYQNRFVMTCEADDFVRGQHIPKLTLQPIVENCIQHAFPDRSRQGHIHVGIWALDGKLVAEIRDDGVGMPPEKLEDIFGDAPPDEVHGISNIRQRIRLYYGAEYGVTARSAPGEGTAIRLTLPLSDPEERREDGL